MQLNLPPGMCGKEAVTVVCNFSLLSTSDHYNSINANQPSKTVPLFTSREEWRGFGFHSSLLGRSTEDFFSLTFNSRNSNIYSRKTLITGMKISCQAWGKPIKKRPARATHPERKGAWWKLGRSQTPHISRTLQLILEVGQWAKVRVVPNEQRHNCANCANCATVSKSDSASVVITVKDCRCTNLYSLCLLLFLKKSVKVFFKSSKSLPLGSEVGGGEILSRKRQHLGRKDGSDEDFVQVTPGIPVIMAIINLVTTRWQFASFGWLEAPIFAVIMQLRVLPVFFMFQCNAQLQFNWTLGPASPGKTFKRKIHRLKL